MSTLDFGGRCSDGVRADFVLHGPGRTGHSGAPVFAADGKLLGLHVAAVDPRSQAERQRSRALGGHEVENGCMNVARSLAELVSNSTATGCRVTPLHGLRKLRWTYYGRPPDQLDKKLLGRHMKRGPKGRR